MWQQILEHLNIMNIIVTAITVPFTVASGIIFVYKKCRKFLRRKALVKLLGCDDVVIHIPTRVAEEALGEKRLKPVVAKEDYNTFEKLREILLSYGFNVSLSYIPARHDASEEYGELELLRDHANIVVCGPRNSRTVEEIFRELDGLNFVKGEDGWYFDDLVDNVQFASSYTDSKKQYAFLGKVLCGSVKVLLVCGISAIGSDGVAHFLGDKTALNNLLTVVKSENFYCIVKSAYNHEAKEIYDAELTQCLRISR